MKTQWSFIAKLAVIIIVVVSLIIIGILIYEALVPMITLAQGELIIKFIQSTITFPTIFLLFLVIFYKQIANFLKNITFFKTPAFEASTQREQTREIKDEKIKPEERIEEAKEQKGITLTETEALELKEKINQNEQELIKKNDAIKEFLEMANYFFVRAEIYEFSYLRYFLVENSKKALLWLKNNDPSSKSYFMANFNIGGNTNSLVYQYDPTLRARDNNEKESIVNALVSNELILIDADGRIRISVKGIGFLKFIGYI